GSELREDELREEEFIQIGHLSLRSESPPGRWSLVVKPEVPPARLLRTKILICDYNSSDESASTALDNARSDAIQNLLSQRSGHNPGAFDVPEVNRQIQTGHIFRRVNNACSARAGIFRLEMGVADDKRVRFRFKLPGHRIVSNLQR